MKDYGAESRYEKHRIQDILSMSIIPLLIYQFYLFLYLFIYLLFYHLGKAFQEIRDFRSFENFLLTPQPQEGIPLLFGTSFSCKFY